MGAKREIAPVAEMIPVIKASIENGKPVELTVTGRSMMPLLKDRVSSVRLAQPDDLKIGSIVLYRRNDGHYVLHRIVSIHNDVYDIVGDNQREPDRNVLRENIIARVYAYTRDGKHWKKSDGLYRALLPMIKTVRQYRSRAKRKLCSLQKNKS